MIREELYVLVRGRREKVDIKSPSGITILFNSNLFADLSKIDCSKSYTFRIPHTANNSRIFDVIEDVRVDSSLYGKRVSCEYWFDGVPLIQNGNLYLSEVSKGEYSAVMIFDVMEGLVNLNDNDISIRELVNDNTDIVKYSMDELYLQNHANYFYEYYRSDHFSNNSIQTPCYNAGVVHYGVVPDGEFPPDYNLEVYYRKIIDDERAYPQLLFPTPVMPVQRIIRKIRDHFGLSMSRRIVQDADQRDLQIMDERDPDIFRLGGIPMVSTNMDEELARKEALIFDGLGGIKKVTRTFTAITGQTETYTVEHVLQFSSAYYANPSHELITLKNDSDRVKTFSLNVHNMCLRISGKIVFSTPSGYTGEAPSISIVSIAPPRYKFEGVIELATIQSEYDDSIGRFVIDINENGWQGVFDLSGFVTPSPAEIMFAANMEDELGILLDQCTIRVEPYFDEGAAGHKCKVMPNLPDVSCMSLMKSLYFMAGGFPKINSSGELDISYFTDIRFNLEEDNIYDWSRYLLIGASGDPDNIKFTNGNLGQNNYYLMKNESVEYKESGSTDDVYGGNKADIVCENQCLDRVKTIYQFPFNGKFMVNGKRKRIPTGESIKYWEIDIRTAKASEAKPAIGFFKILRDQDLDMFGMDDLLGFEVWQMGTQYKEYEFLQELLRKPVIIRVPMRCPMADLLHIDYTKPVYLEQLNSVFAIIKVEISSSGSCVAELLKLTNNYHG